MADIPPQASVLKMKYSIAFFVGAATNVAHTQVDQEPAVHPALLKIQFAGGIAQANAP